MSDNTTWKPVVAAIIPRDATILVCQRTPHQPFPLHWEFPGGKVEPGEPLPAALIRELHEELAIHATIGPLLTTVRHRYAGGLGVELHFFLVPAFTPEPVNRIFHEIRWHPRATLDAAIFLEADQPIVRSLQRGELL